MYISVTRQKKDNRINSSKMNSIPSIGLPLNLIHLFTFFVNHGFTYCISSIINPGFLCVFQERAGRIEAECIAVAIDPSVPLPPLLPLLSSCSLSFLALVPSFCASSPSVPVFPWLGKQAGRWRCSCRCGAHGISYRIKAIRVTNGARGS